MTFTASASSHLELGRPITDRCFAPRPGQPAFRDVRLLVTLHGDPLGMVALPLDDHGHVSARAIAEAVAGELVAEIAAHWQAQACGTGPSGADHLLPGLGSACAGWRTRPGTPPHATVIIPTAGRPDDLRRCVASLQAMTYPSFTVLVVDNRPDDPATRAVVAEFDCAAHPVRCLAEPRPGSAVARNRGIAECDSEIVAFTDDDVLVHPDWLSAMVEPMRRDPAVDVVCGLVLAGDLLTPAQRRFEDAVGFHKGFVGRAYDLQDNRADDRLLYPFWGGVFGSGNSMAFRREPLARIGGFDPALGAGTPARGGTDIEVFTHLILKGSRLVYEPRSVCWHDHRRDEVGLDRQLFNYGVGFSAILTKWAVRDVRLWSAVLRSLLLVARGRHRSVTALSGPQAARAAERRQRRGMLVGPLYYVRSLRWCARLQLRNVLPAHSGA